MTTRFYLGPAYNKVYNNQGYIFEPKTCLAVNTDILGFYLQCKEDPYGVLGFAPRKELDGLVSSYSCCIAVREQAYLGDIATGVYTYGDEKTSIVVGELTEFNFKRAREMTVSAPTWGRIELAIEKIRRGEITPGGKEQTVLERVQLEKESFAKISADFSKTIRRADRFVNQLVEFLATADGYNGEQLGLSVDQNELLRLVRQKKAQSEELAGIKATRWYRVMTWFNNSLMKSGARQPSSPA